MRAIKFWSPGVTCAVLLFVGAHNSIAAPVEFGTAACEKKITEPSVNAIIQEVFYKKVTALSKEGKIQKTFWTKTKDLGYAICDNKASYDTFVVYGVGVVFDYQMVGFLFAQSRALMVGRYISVDKQFAVHAELVRQFIKQGAQLTNGPFEIIKAKALELGMKKETLDALLLDPQFNKREQTLFLQALYFLAMHERCHVALDHGPRIEAIRLLPEAKRLVKRQELELKADQCALEIINADEAEFKSSPISFFGVLMTVATQAIIANQPKLVTERSHPSTLDRMKAAKETTLVYISKRSNSDPELALNYESTIRGTAAYFDDLLAAKVQ